MAQRARAFQERTVGLTAKSEIYARSNSSYRFYNEKTAEYFVHSLPSIDYDVGEMYSGQIQIGNDSSRNMFFVFEPTIGEPVDEVTIWFNGGPGCSSLEAFLQENGRFIWGWGMYSAVENPYTWVNLTNVLWVEYPVGLGFSTGSVTATSEEETAQDFLGFFENFLDTFGITNFKIYVTGESYAGRYVPYVSAAMLDRNDTSKFDLSGALMYDPVIGQYEYVGQVVPTVPYVQNHANFFNLNDTLMAELALAHEACGYANYTNYFLTFPPPAQQPVLNTLYSTANISGVNCDVWNLVYEAASQPNPCFNVYEISTMCPIQSDPLAYPGDLEYQYPGMGGIYFNRTDVKMAMHAPLNVSWSECSGPVFKGDGGVYELGDYSLDPIQKVLPQVIEATNRVLVANGDYDMEIITNGTLLSIQNMTWNGKLGFQTKPTTPIDIQLPDLQYQAVFDASGMSGYDGPRQGIMGTQHFERGLMWAETYQSGHMQPQFQPRSSYRHLQWLLGRIEEL
ncbi:alpha/beta-hydrolase [Viridothelium virens]|uniref:Carboxypeptidase n=1 Tax=Viridothelium virens TaxID=1048519 RepID=A0A6A6GS74_VIRVR|nr:alpha/beta-hydrolase [Viridothelium virens]